MSWSINEFNKQFQILKNPQQVDPKVLHFRTYSEIQKPAKNNEPYSNHLSSSRKLNHKYRTLSLGSYKMFFTVENNQLVYKFI